jgi:hypothetical protein
MNCKHEKKKFLSVIDYRGYPEKLYLCETCGITISDYISDQELEHMDTESAFDHPEEDLFERYSGTTDHLRNEIL